MGKYLHVNSIFLYSYMFILVAILYTYQCFAGGEMTKGDLRKPKI